MSKAKKFGAFAGVFTPSILTILGVIMYLRLGWVVGEAGLMGAIAIILIAHVISVTTGLSISSISTDKKIKGGGIYYILSRSLGLPMGGAIGITIFVGTALSIALYLVGFAENFLGIESISDALGLENSIQGVRIVGTMAIIFLVIIAFISTSLAIKTQYIVLSAIALSLVSIVIGLFTNTGITPASPNFAAAPQALPFEAIFAIFFPAVTGFTAGVAMSGDLGDPRKSIPRGTLWAIAVGLVVYLGLALLFGYFVKRDILLTDYNFLLRVATWAPFVVAGIWGATLSSALGGILGAPRILQAVSRDRILPRIFGKGFGASNEPRNALILTFVIAETGILIGELDVIARIVSMFYIAAYGFINLAYALERWASPDFRPSFRIPKWIGVVGFIACFGVMFKLDTVAMVLAILIMFGIYFFLTKKELQVDFGDVWQSVWSSIVRSSLHRISRTSPDEKNWQPNIILFSGGTRARPHLIDFGKHLAGRQGFLSNFDLVQADDKQLILPRHRQTIYDDQQSERKGIFTRQHVCSDIYEGIRTIAGTYGFSGIEPNTVMMGWARQSENPSKFLETINYLKALDMNILMMDYDKEQGFGKYNQIDIWWRTTEHNGNLALILLKFLWLSNEWRNAKARILIVNPVNDQKEVILRNTRNILDNMRIQAEVKVINNQIEQRSFYDIVQVESVNSDLIFMGLPDISSGTEQTFVEETNKLCQDIGTVILLKASTNFKKLRIGIKRYLLSTIDRLENKVQEQEVRAIPISDIRFPEKAGVARQVKLLYGDLMQISNYFDTQFLTKLFGYHESLINDVEEAVNKSFANIREKTLSGNSSDKQKTISKFESNLLFRFRKLVSDFEKEIFEIQRARLRESITYYFNEIDKVILSSPKFIRVELNEDDLDMRKTEKFQQKLFKLKHRIRRNLNPSSKTSYRLKYRLILLNYLQMRSGKLLFEMLDKWGIATLRNVIKGRQLIFDVAVGLFELEKKLPQGLVDKALIDEKHDEITRKIEGLRKINNDSHQNISRQMISGTGEIIKKLAQELNQVNANRAIRKNLSDQQSRKNIRQFILSIPQKWERNQILHFNSVLLELGLLAFITKLRIIFTDVADETRSVFDEYILGRQLGIREQLSRQAEKLAEDPDYKFSTESIGELEHREVVQSYFNQIIETTFRKIKLATSVLPDLIEVMEEESLNNFNNTQFRQVKSISISVAQLMDFLLQGEFVEPLQQSLSDLPKRLDNLNASTNETIRNIAFGIDQESEKRQDDQVPSEIVVDILEKQIEVLDGEIEKTQDMKNHIVLLFQERMNTFEDKLSYHSFIKSAVNLKQYIRDIESRKRWNFLQSRREKTRNYIQHQLNQFWYRQSIGVLVSKRLREDSGSEQFRVSEALTLLEKVSIRPDIESSLPFFYKQLFLRKQYHLNEFWVGRDKELREAEKAIQRYLSGLMGGILVIGDHNEGKTFFSQYFVNKFYRSASIYQITAPYGGSIDTRLFKDALESTLEISGSYYRIFNSIPDNSVLIIDDLSLWWEKSANGAAVMLQIMELIDKYSQRCLFVLNLNKFSFELMNKMHHIENYFLNIIELQPFNSEDLQKVILARHSSTSFQLRLARRMNDNLRPWNYARLFSKYYTFSEGNVGVALNSWLANISDVRGNILFIEYPRIPDLAVLDHLKPDWYLLILQLILHKRANLKKLSRICQENIQDLKGIIDILRRSGIIEEKNPGIYELNGFLYPHIKSKLIEKDMI